MSEGHSTAGRSIIETIWAQADIKYAQLMERVEDNTAWTEAQVVKLLKKPSASATETAADIRFVMELRGALQGLAYALGRMLHMYEPPKEAMDKIRAELRERWEASLEEDDEEEEDLEEDLEEADDEEEEEEDD